MNEKILIKEDYTEKLIIQDKLIEELQLIYCEFKESVSILNCKIKNASFQAAYFGKDLLIKDSEFINNVDFSLGDTINTQGVFKIENVIFNEFVSFQDYSFRGKTIFENVNFKKGTNLLGNKNTPVEVTFYSEPILINISGVLDKNDFK
jgi:hypothetical protein